MTDPFDAEFRHPRLAAVYDVECPWSRDDDWFLARLVEHGARRTLDFGCGTGRLAAGLAERGFEVVGVDPASASLERARHRSLAVEWIEGSVGAIPDGPFDAVVMTSHVAQFFVGDAEFALLLARLHDVLRPGGVLLFDSRDPAGEAWRAWNPSDSRRTHVLGDDAQVEVHTEVLAVQDGRVRFVHRYAFTDGECLESVSTLRFRSEAELRDALTTTGLHPSRIDGGWDGQPVGAGDGELLVTACRAKI